MTHGICLWMAAALRAAPSHTAEMVSQLLFGETYEILESQPEWLKVCTDDCGYEAWLQRKQHTPVSEEELTALRQTSLCRVDTLFQYIRDKAFHIPTLLCAGACYPNPVDRTFTLAGRTFVVEPTDSLQIVRHEGLTESQDRMLSFALQYLNAPYLWGGRTPAGIDCSGFTQLVYASIGIALPRDASQQVQMGTPVDFVDEACIGDLAFFGNEEGKIIHVGMVCGHRQILHASGHVQINTLDETGIFRDDMGQYTHSLRVIKRIL
jgi:Cell wall-associated hydrolases (invasion-associated proteins)